MAAVNAVVIVGYTLEVAATNVQIMRWDTPRPSKWPLFIYPGDTRDNNVRPCPSHFLHYTA